MILSGLCRAGTLEMLIIYIIDEEEQKTLDTVVFKCRFLRMVLECQSDMPEMQSMFIDFVNLDDYKDKRIYLVEHDGFKYTKLSNNTIPFNIDNISDSSTISALYDLL